MRLNDVPHDDGQEPFSFTPFVDVLFVLLFITLMEGMAAADPYAMATNRPGIPNPQPQPTSSKDLPVAVTAAGGYLVDGAAVEPAALENRLREAKATAPDLIVFVDGDARSPYGSVVRLEDLCDRLGISYRRLVNKEP
jgi:biopolymer transport protein ExbD